MIYINTGGWVYEVPEGTAFIDAYDGGFTAYDADGAALDAGPHITLDDPPWFKRIPQEQS